MKLFNVAINTNLVVYAQDEQHAKDIVHHNIQNHLYVIFNENHVNVSVIEKEDQLPDGWDTTTHPYTSDSNFYDNECKEELDETNNIGALLK